MHVLAIDTAGPVVGVALLANDEVVVRTARVRRGADALLLPWAEELVSQAGISLRQLDGIGVAHGPGAFTGLRVGLATAVGLALAIDRPLWGCSSLEARAARVPQAASLLTMLDARKKRVYAAARTPSGVHGPGDIPPEEALGWMTAPFVATGEGAIVYRELVEAAGGQLSAEPAHPGVDALARLAREAIAAGHGKSAATVMPVYLRAPDAKPPNKTRGSNVGTDLNIAIAGATGALGKELISVLDASPWRPRGLLPAARAATTTDFVDYGDQQIAVDDVATLDFESLDGLIVATPRDCATELIDKAVAAGVPVVDCSGSQLANLEVPLVIPWVNGAALDGERARDVAAVPTPAALMLTSLLSPLSRQGWAGTASATLMMPASWWGHHGVEELSQQVIALFNHGTPARRVFDQGLAFDLLPAVGDIGATSWTSAEVHSVAEVARLTGIRCDLTLVGVPVFSGMSATVRIETEDLAPETAARHLADAGIQLIGDEKRRKLPRPRRVEGEPWLYAARVRRGLDGRSLHLWLSMDNLRVSASAAVGTLARLLRTDHADMLSDGPEADVEG